jgi:hypothetical protein
MENEMLFCIDEALEVPVGSCSSVYFPEPGSTVLFMVPKKAWEDKSVLSDWSCLGDEDKLREFLESNEIDALQECTYVTTLKPDEIRNLLTTNSFTESQELFDYLAQPLA